jgi:hypothetical protein
VLRESDSAEIDVGFTAGGLYDIKREFAWAAGSSTRVLRWYNQSSYAPATGYPSYLSMINAADSPTGIIGTTVQQFNGYPAIQMYYDTTLLESAGESTIPYDAKLSAVWIGNVDWNVGPAETSYPFSIHFAGLTSQMVLVQEGNETELQDIGPYVWDRAYLISHPTTWLDPTLYVATYGTTTSPFDQDYWANGLSSASVSGGESEKGADFTPGPLALGAKQMIHTIIQGGDASGTISDLAKTSFNRNNWIY